MTVQQGRARHLRFALTCTYFPEIFIGLVRFISFLRRFQLFVAVVVTLQQPIGQYQ